jgi:hypothetical protein
VSISLAQLWATQRFRCESEGPRFWAAQRFGCESERSCVWVAQRFTAAIQVLNSDGFSR